MKRSDEQKDKFAIELEKALGLSTADMEEKCEDQERKTTEAMKALMGYPQSNDGLNSPAQKVRPLPKK
jgi:hypothetical protein